MPHAIFSTFNIIHRRDILPNNRLAIFDDLENITTFYNSDLVQKSWTCYSYLVIHEPKMAFLLCYFHPKVQEWHLSQTYYIPRAVVLSLQSQYYWLGQGSILPWTIRYINPSEIPLEKWSISSGTILLYKSIWMASLLNMDWSMKSLSHSSKWVSFRLNKAVKLHLAGWIFAGSNRCRASLINTQKTHAIYCPYLRMMLMTGKPTRNYPNASIAI